MPPLLPGAQPGGRSEPPTQLGSRGEMAMVSPPHPLHLAQTRRMDADRTNHLRNRQASVSERGKASTEGATARSRPFVDVPAGRVPQETRNSNRYNFRSGASKTRVAAEGSPSQAGTRSEPLPGLAFGPTTRSRQLPTTHAVVTSRTRPRRVDRLSGLCIPQAGVAGDRGPARPELLAPGALICGRR